MNVEVIFDTMNRHGVRYLLIGGMNFMLRHEPISTYDVDLWIEDTEVNRRRCETALANLDAEWGPTDEAWGPVKHLSTGWLDDQGMYCLTSPQGAIDVFRSVEGLDSWQDSWSRGIETALATGTSYFALSDEDMIRCQLALPEGLQKKSRVRKLNEAIERRRDLLP